MMPQDSREVKLIKFQRVVIGFLTTALGIVLSLGVYDFVVADQVNDNVTAIATQASTQVQQSIKLDGIKNDIKAAGVVQIEVLNRLTAIETTLKMRAGP